MLLCEAKEQIDSRINDSEEWLAKQVPDYLEALKIASKCIDAQMRLADILNDFYADFELNDSWSVGLVEDVLNEIRFDRKEQEE